MRHDSSTHRQPARSLLLSLLFALGFLAPAAQPQAQQLDGLSEFLMIGEDAPWTGKMDGEAYVLSNSENAGALKYITASYDTKDDGKRTIAVDVEIRNAGEGAREGLLYALVPEPKSYLIFVIEPGHKLGLYRRNANGIKQLLGLASDAVADGTNRLSIVEQGKKINLLVNGKPVGSFTSPAMGHGTAGIAAVGVGVFAFKNYEQAVH